MAEATGVAGTSPADGPRETAVAQRKESSASSPALARGSMETAIAARDRWRADNVVNRKGRTEVAGSPEVSTARSARATAEHDDPSGEFPVLPELLLGVAQGRTQSGEGGKGILISSSLGEDWPLLSSSPARRGQITG